MADKRAQFKRIVAARIARGEHYMTQEKYIAQIEFCKNAHDSGRLKDNEVSLTSDRKDLSSTSG